MSIMSVRSELFDVQCPMCPFLEHDEFDTDSDHLVAYKLTNAQIVGNFRLRRSPQQTLYSSTEFEIEDLLNSVGGCVEVSRACVRRLNDERTNRLVLHRLIQRMVSYAGLVKARYICGVLSVPLDEEERISGLVAALKNQQTIGLFDLSGVLPRGEVWEGPPLLSVKQNFRQLMPPLMFIFHRAGAVFSPNPFIDRIFNCVDFFGLLDLHSMSKYYARLYGELAKPSV